jgi:8-oxo-dGTP pyrophosphatase MutT (NUDIX family)
MSNLLKEKLSEIGTDKTCPTVLLFKNGKLLVGLRHYTPDKYKKISVWTTPGGRCDSYENIELALRREVKEEVGITDFILSEFLGKVPGPKDGDLVYVFKGSTKQEPQLLEPEKFSEWRWANIDEIPENFINPEVLDLLK